MRKHVTLVLPDFEAGGAQRVMVMIANALDRARFAPSIIALDERGPWRSLVAGDVPVTGLGHARLRHGLKALRAALRTAAPDVIISTIGYLNFGVLMSRPAGVPVIVREANSPGRGLNRLSMRAAQRLAYAALYRFAASVVTNSEGVADELARAYQVPRRFIRVIYNPIDEAALRGAATPPARRPGEGARFVAVGRLSHQKGYDRLLDALAMFTGDFHLTIFGEGEERSPLEAKSQALGLADHVTFAGFDPNPAPWIAGADALWLPSRWEGMPNVALEALACGTPVIATPEAGGITEIAGLAKPGIVTLAPMGYEFFAALAGIPITDGRLRPSFLPAEFQLALVVRQFEQLIDGVCRAPQSVAAFAR
jgi:glycosyltransferase involved in cell wall biosynthesis